LDHRLGQYQRQQVHHRPHAEARHEDFRENRSSGYPFTIKIVVVIVPDSVTEAEFIHFAELLENCGKYTQFHNYVIL
jgi:hypothetical protein